MKNYGVTKVITMELDGNECLPNNESMNNNEKFDTNPQMSTLGWCQRKGVGGSPKMFRTHPKKTINI